MHIRRYTRLTNAHSKSHRHHSAMTSLFVAWYNYCRCNSGVRQENHSCNGSQTYGAFMDDQRTSRGGSVSWILGVGSLLIGLYVVSYFQLSYHGSTFRDLNKNLAQVHVFGSYWEASFFKPAVIVESWVTGKDCQIVIRNIPLSPYAECSN